MLISFNYVSAEATAKLYNEPVMEELYTGYLSFIYLSQKSWKRRFFVLSKTGEDYQLTYHANNEKRNKPLGEIDISKISLLFTSPEAHQKWDWIQKQFKCSPSFVLFLKVDDDTPKQAREYFLIGENRDEVDGWLNALVKVMTTQKSQNKLRHTDDTQDKRFRSKSVPVNCLEPKDGRWSAFELTSPQQYDHYENPRKFSEPLVPVTHKIPVIEEKDEKDGKQDEPPVDSSEYMTMGSVQMVLEGDQQEDDTQCGYDKCGICVFLLCSETHTYGEKEICVSQNELKNSLILTQEEGKPCVSKCGEIPASCQFHKGDQILAVNDLLTDTVKEVQTYLRRLSKSEVKLTIRRLPDSIPLHSEPC
uniref:PH domain-containing protein n=1 Tax=Sinocyclocheilus rhinocerous TaxID=307959 RepID=A0A673IN26_9TELE